MAPVATNDSGFFEQRSATWVLEPPFCNDMFCCPVELYVEYAGASRSHSYMNCVTNSLAKNPLEAAKNNHKVSKASTKWVNCCRYTWRRNTWQLTQQIDWQTTWCEPDNDIVWSVISYHWYANWQTANTCHDVTMCENTHRIVDWRGDIFFCFLLFCFVFFLDHITSLMGIQQNNNRCFWTHQTIVSTRLLAKLDTMFGLIFRQISPDSQSEFLTKQMLANIR